MTRWSWSGGYYSSNTRKLEQIGSHGDERLFETGAMKKEDSNVSAAAMAAITSGGTANVAVGISSNRVSDGFTLAQHYAGGGLSAYTGFSAFAASTSESKYLLGKFDDKILSYGLQANVVDFAYANSRESYLNKNFGQHFGTFVFGGLGGALQGHAMDYKFVKLSPKLNMGLIKWGRVFWHGACSGQIDLGGFAG